MQGAGISAKFRIGVSARGLSEGSFAIATLIYELVTLVIDNAPDDFEILVFHHHQQDFGKFPRATQIQLPHTNRFYWDHWVLPRALKQHNINVGVFFKNAIPLIPLEKTLVVMHDMGYFYPGAFYETISSLYMRWIIRYSAQNASRVITPSVSTKNDLLRLFNLPAEKIAVTPWGYNPAPAPSPADLQAVQVRYNLPERFMFFPTSISPRKNIDRVLQAYQAVQDQMPHSLVMTGGQSWNTYRLNTGLKAGKFPGVIRLGNLPAADLPALYTLSDFTIYPSLLEGFGMPVIEAFTHGSPLLTSNITSIPEVAGEAAYLVNPYSLPEIKAGILRLAQDDDLKQTLREKGRHQAQAFTWKKTADKLLDILAEMVS